MPIEKIQPRRVGRSARVAGNVSCLVFLFISLSSVRPVLGFDPEPESANSQGIGGEGAAQGFLYTCLCKMKEDSPQEFLPLDQSQRNGDFAKSFFSQSWYWRSVAYAGVKHLGDAPEEWGQGMSGYGKRLADGAAKYAIRKSVTFGLESLLHEDNRYFVSGGKGFLPRAGYALSSGILARHDNGKRYPSVSVLTGYASSSYLSRLWQPPGHRSIGDAASSFGINMGMRMGYNMFKEFLPDLLGALQKKQRH